MKKNGLKHTAAQGLTIILTLVLMLALMPVMGEKAMAEDETSFMSDNCIYTIINTSDHSVRLDSYRGDDRELIVPETVEHEGITYTVVKEENTTIDIVVKRPGFKIYGKKGSAAHKYAKANKFKCVKY